MTIRRLAGVLVAIVSAIVGAGCGGSDEARPDLAFVSTRDGDYAIFEMNADGGGAAQAHAAREHRGVVSRTPVLPDRARMVSRRVADRLLEPRAPAPSISIVMNADGTGTRAVDLRETGRLTPDVVERRHPTRVRARRRHLRDRRRRLGAAPSLRHDRRGARAVLVARRHVDRIRPSHTRNSRHESSGSCGPNGSERRALTSQDATVATPAWSPDSDAHRLREQPGRRRLSRSTRSGSTARACAA